MLTIFKDSDEYLKISKKIDVDILTNNFYHNREILFTFYFNYHLHDFVCFYKLLQHKNQNKKILYYLRVFITRKTTKKRKQIFLKEKKWMESFKNVLYFDNKNNNIKFYILILSCIGNKMPYISSYVIKIFPASS